ncbi:MAG: MBL fold metallo-hydrolase [Gammaproteobacteria bacterium]
MSGTARRWLREEVALRVVYEDHSAFGAALSGRCEAELHKRLAVLHAYRQKYGLQRLISESAQVLGRVLPGALADLYATPDTLRADWLYPDPGRVRPAYLRVESSLDDSQPLIPLPPALAAELADWLGAWQAGAAPPRSAVPRALWEALCERDAFSDAPPASESLPAPGMSMVGHATLRATDGQRQALFDPFLLPRASVYPADWQPASAASLGQPDAVFITHSHPDHFDPCSLLRFGAEVPVFVPAVARESVLAIDMQRRLLELGFRQVHALAPGACRTVGELEIEALPFFGEQPTIEAVLHPEVRNIGLTYAVRYRAERIAVLADSGADHTGDVRHMVSAARARRGDFTRVFGGYRGFAVYPVQYLFSSVSRYLPFVPPALWNARQQIMCDATALLDVAERAGASRVVPYADGGAPWFWLRGLGPNLDSGDAAAMATDPPPSHVADVARQRAHTLADGPLASPVTVDLPRVGDHLPF